MLVVFLVALFDQSKYVSIIFEVTIDNKVFSSRNFTNLIGLVLCNASINTQEPFLVLGMVAGLNCVKFIQLYQFSHVF